MRYWIRRPAVRLALLGSILMAALACGGTTCDCVTPLEAPIAEDAKMYDAIQARLTPSAFGFLESNLPAIVGSFMPGGLAFDVPPSSSRFCMIICFDIDICPNTCQLTAEIVDATLTRTAPNILALDALLNVDGTIYLRRDITCDVPIHMRNKPVHADIYLLRDGKDHLLYFTLTNLQLTIADSDYTLDCSGLLGWLIELLKGTVTNTLNDQLNSQISDMLNQQVADATCLPCTFYTGGCPTGSACDGTYCMESGFCRIKPMGMVGTMDLTDLLSSLPGSSPNGLDLFVAAGQWEDSTVDYLVVNDGVEVRLIGGADTTTHPCVPAPNPLEIPSNVLPARMPFGDTIPGTSISYMAGIAVSDAFLDWFMYHAYLTGLLCLSLGTETSDLLTSSTLALVGLSSLNDLTGRRNVPVKLRMRPSHVPFMEVGAGTFTTDANGNKVIDQPLLYLFIPGMGIDFLAPLDERWTRFLTVTLDMTMEIGLDLTADNRLIPLIGEENIHLDNVVVSNYELLAEDPAALENLMPTLIGMALPMLTNAINPIELPPIQGFVLNILAMQGDIPRAGTNFYDYLGIYADLTMAPPAAATLNTYAKVAELRVPHLERMSLYAPAGPMYPEVILEVSTDTGAEAEYSYRVDRGFWRPFQPGPRLTVHDAQLLLPGRHQAEVRARLVGDYHTLDPTPVSLSFDVLPKSGYLDPPTTGRLGPSGTTPRTAMPLLHTNQDRQAQDGCACAQGSPTAPTLALLLMGLFILRKRSPSR